MPQPMLLFGADFASFVQNRPRNDALSICCASLLPAAPALQLTGYPGASPALPPADTQLASGGTGCDLPLLQDNHESNPLDRAQSRNAEPSHGMATIRTTRLQGVPRGRDVEELFAQQGQGRSNS